MAYAYLTKADIDRDKGDLRNAERYAKQSLDIFNRLEDNEGSAQTYRTLANISRYSRKYEEALRYLRDGIMLIEQSNSLALLASLYQFYGRTYRHYAIHLQEETEPEDDAHRPEKSDTINDALAALQESIRLSRKIGNRWETARSQIEIVLIMMLSDGSYDEDKVNDLLDQVWRTASDLEDNLLKGYVCENRARIEMRKGKYLEAGKAFGEAAYHIANRTGMETTWAFDRLYHVLLDSRLDNEQYNALARGIREQVLQQEDHQDYPKLIALIDMCEQIMDMQITGRDQQ